MYCTCELSAILVTCCVQEIGEGWVIDLMKLKDLLPLATKSSFLRSVLKVKKVSHMTYTLGIRMCAYL